MGRNSDLFSKENAEHRAEIRAAIGRMLRKTYDVEVPLTARLTDLVRKIEQSPSESGQSDRAGTGA